MGTLALEHVFTPLDLIALAYFLLTMVGYRIVLRTSFVERRSLIGAMQRRRIDWMANMAERGGNRTMDVILLNHLSQGNAFFASTTAIAIGGTAAVMGSGERAQAVLDRLPYVQASNPILWEVKLFVIMAIFIFAFFKFAWAFRLSHYTSIMIGATPLIDETSSQPQLDGCHSHAERTARLAGLSAEHANGGIRAFYYVTAVMAWFFHPIAFVAATTWVMVILIRRDFFSRTLRLVRAGQVADDPAPRRRSSSAEAT